MLISTGDGKSRDMDFRTTIYKREPDQVYQLKMKASRAIFSEVEKKFDTMCFNLRSLADEKKAKMGINECVNHGLITPFPVLFEKEDEIVAQFKFTTLLMPNGPLRITGLPFDVAQYESEKKIDDEEILVRSKQYFSNWYLWYFFRKFWLNQLLRSQKRRIRRSKLKRPQLKLLRLLPNSYKKPTSALFVPLIKIYQNYSLYWDVPQS